MITNLKELRMPNSGNLYKHYKGGVYVIDKLTYSAKTGNIEVAYYNIEDKYENTCNRDLGEFLGLTDDHQQRFSFLKEHKYATCVRSETPDE